MSVSAYPECMLCRTLPYLSSSAAIRLAATSCSMVISSGAASSGTVSSGAVSPAVCACSSAFPLSPPRCAPHPASSARVISHARREIVVFLFILSAFLDVNLVPFPQTERGDERFKPRHSAVSTPESHGSAPLLCGHAPRLYCYVKSIARNSSIVLTTNFPSSAS